MANTALEDDDREPFKLLVEHRLPWLTVGLVGGMAATLLAARFEKLLEANIALSFFIPVIVYMADAVGTQTENIFVRNLTRAKKFRFLHYLFKEIILGLLLGALFGAAMGVFAYFMFSSFDTALTVGLAMFVTMAIAPTVALLVPEVLWKEHTDPAIGSGPFTTIVQDLLSLLIYFIVATFIILS